MNLFSEEYKHVYKFGMTTILSEGTCMTLFREIDSEISRYEYQFHTQGSITYEKFIWVFLGNPLYATVKIKSQQVKSDVFQLIIHVTTKDSNNKCVFFLTRVTTTQFDPNMCTTSYFGQSNLDANRLLYWKVGANHD
jgi:hypothetical protein